jgi:hypothetical protein
VPGDPICRFCRIGGQGRRALPSAPRDPPLSPHAPGPTSRACAFVRGRRNGPFRDATQGCRIGAFLELAPSACSAGAAGHAPAPLNPSRIQRVSEGSAPRPAAMMRPLNVGLENPGDGEADAPITDVVLTDGTEGYRGGGVDVTSLTIADEEGPAMPRPLADTLALAVLAVVVPVSVEAVGRPCAPVGSGPTPPGSWRAPSSPPSGTGGPAARWRRDQPPPRRPRHQGRPRPALRPAAGARGGAQGTPRRAPGDPRPPPPGRGDRHPVPGRLPPAARVRGGHRRGRGPPCRGTRLPRGAPRRGRPGAGPGRGGDRAAAGRTGAGRGGDP